MAKIIGFEEIHNIKKQTAQEAKLRQEIEKIEKELGLEDDPILVLSEQLALTLGNYLLDIREEVDAALGILGVSETDKLPEGLDWEE